MCPSQGNLGHTRWAITETLFILTIKIVCTLAPQLVAMGTFLNPDTTRIVAKRVVLTGHPFKVHKKTATVRYMFFNSGSLPSFFFSVPRLICFSTR